MAIYAIAIIPLLLILAHQAEQLSRKRTKSVAYADGFNGASSITNLTLVEHPHHIRSTIWEPP